MSDDAALPDLARLTRRLAVLLGAGVTPASAWQHLGVDVGDDVAIALQRRGQTEQEREAWRGLAAAWVVATDAGAPLAPSLRGYAESLTSLAQSQRDARVALAGPAATARIVMALPALGLLFGLALGFDTIGVLVGTPVGWACLVIGAALLVAAWRWNRGMIAAAAPKTVTPGIDCDLMAIAVSGGAALRNARSAVAAALERFGLAPSNRVDAVLDLSSRAGVPAAELLRAEAEEARADARAEAQASAARLAVRLMLPLGLCVLPSFMVLGVLPLIVSIVTSTGAGL